MCLAAQESVPVWRITIIQNNICNVIILALFHVIPFNGGNWLKLGLELPLKTDNFAQELSSASGNKSREDGAIITSPRSRGFAFYNSSKTYLLIHHLVLEG